MRTAAAGLAVAAMLCLTACHPVQTRDDFKGAVMSKSTAEVEQRLGKPDSIEDADPTRLIWVYDKATFDIANNNKPDPKARVIFGRQEAAGSESVIEVDFGS